MMVAQARSRCPLTARRTAFASASAGRRSSRRTHRAVRARAANEGDEDATTTTSTPDAGNPGFYYDKANLRWVRDDKRGLPLSDWEAGGMTTIKTKTGEEYTVWPAIHIFLDNYGLRSLPGQEVLDMVKEGKAVVVDVRPEYQYEQNGRIEGSVNVPLYRSVQGNSLMKTIKKLAVAAMAMEATERNSDFREDAKKVLASDPAAETRLLVVCCSIGGSMETETVSKRGKVFSDPEKAFGRESRSLKACYELIQAGFPNVAHLEGGIAMWRHEDRPMTK